MSDYKITANARELRKNSTPAEKILWNHLRNRQLYGPKFRRQHPIPPFIVDFYCAQIHLVIEVDGEIHNFQQDQDQSRQEWLEENGYKVIRFTNDQIFNQLDWVLTEIMKTYEFDV